MDADRSKAKSAAAESEGGTAVHINFIPPGLDSEDLRELFSQAGIVAGVNVFKPKGFSDPVFQFGNVQFTKMEEAQKAIEMFNGKLPHKLIVRLFQRSPPKKKAKDEAGKRTGTQKADEDQNDEKNRQPSARGRGRGAIGPTGNYSVSFRGGLGGNHNARGRGNSSSDRGREESINIRGRGRGSSDRGSGDNSSSATGRGNGSNFVRGWEDGNSFMGRGSNFRGRGGSIRGFASSARGGGELLSSGNILQADGNDVFALLFDKPASKGALLPTPAIHPHLEASGCRGSSNYSADDDEYLMDTSVKNLPMNDRITITLSGNLTDVQRSVQILPNATKATVNSLSDRFARLNSGMSNLPNDETTTFSSYRQQSRCTCAEFQGNGTKCLSCKRTTPRLSARANYQNVGTDRSSTSGHRSSCSEYSELSQTNFHVPNNGPGLLPTPSCVKYPESSTSTSSQATTHKKSSKYMVFRPTTDDKRQSQNGSSRPAGSTNSSGSGQSKQPDTKSRATDQGGGSGAKKSPKSPGGKKTKPASANSSGSDKTRSSAGTNTRNKQSKSRDPAVTITSVAISNDKPNKVIMVHASDPSLFYLQLSDNLDFQELMKKLNSAASEMKCPEKVAPGDVLGCKFADDCWYRVQVEKVDNSSALVNYIDYGNSATVELKDLRSICPFLPISFIAFPRQAIKCALDAVEPCDATWSDDATVTFRRFCDNYKDNLFARLVRHSSDGKSIVTLTQGTEKGLSIGKVLCQKRQAQPPLHIRLSCIESWKKGQKIRLIFTGHGDEPRQIWAKYDALTSVEVDEFFGGLNASCIDLPEAIESQIQVNDLVAAKNVQDGNWYRAVVLKRVGPVSFHIRYLDLGIVKDVTSVLPLPKLFWRAPSLAVLLKVEEQHFPSQLPPKAILHAILCNSTKMSADVTIQLDSGTDLTFTAKAISVWTECLAEISQSQMEMSECPTEISQTKNSLPVEPVVGSLPPQAILDQKVVVRAIQLESLTSLHVQVLSEDNIKILKELEQLSDACITDSSLELNGILPMVGQLVCAKFSEDQAWYRAIVKKVEPSGDAVSVRFIDYGNEGTTGVDSLRLVPPAFARTPMVWREVAPLTLRSDVTLTAMKETLKMHDDWVMSVVDGDCAVPTVTLSDAAGVGLDQLLNG